MPTLAELRAHVRNRVPDPISGDSVITAQLNLGVLQIAGGILSPSGSYITPPLPKLFKTDTVDTSTSLAYVSAPATFQRSLQFVSNSDGREIEIYNSMIEFAEDYPLMDGSGPVESIVEQGGTIYYQKIPTVAETLTLHFFRLPVDMSGDDDTPDGIPSHLAEDLLVNFACIKIFQTQKKAQDRSAEILWHTDLFNKAMRLLELSIPQDTRSLFLGD